MNVRTRHINGISMSEVNAEIGNVNISHSHSKAVVDRITPGLAIKYVEYGKESYQVRNKIVSISKGQFFLLRNDTYFKASNTSRNRLTKGCCVNLNLDSLLVPKEILENDLLYEIPFSAVNSSGLGADLKNLASKEFFDPEQIHAKIPELPETLHSFSNGIYEMEDKLSGACKKKQTLRSILEALFKSREFVYQNYRGKISLDDLAKVSNLSKYHLLRLFSRCFNVSPLQLMQDLRMQAAKEMITSQQSSLTDIAISLGYSDLASFSNNFKTKYGCPPSKYLNSL